MHNPLRKRFKRELKSHAGRYFSIFVIFAVMVAIISGFLVVSNGARLTYESDHIISKIEDGRFSVMLPLTDDMLGAMGNLGVITTENYSVDTTILSDKILRIYQTRDKMDIPTVWEGVLPQSESDIAVDRVFAANNDLAVGESLLLADKNFTVCGLISLPDYSSMFQSNTDLMMDTFNFGVALTSPDGFTQLPQGDVIYNYSYRCADRDLSEEQRNNLAEDMKVYLVENQVFLTSFITAENNQSISFLGNDLGSDVPMMKTFLYIIQIIMAFVFTVIIASSVEEESAIVGTLLASGYRKSELVRHYLTMPIIITFAGAAVGTILSYTATMRLFSRIYYQNYCLPPLIVQFNTEAFLLTTFFPVLLVVTVNAAMVYRTMSISPLKFLRRDIKRAKQKKTRQLPDISFLGRFRLRVILQNKGSYLILFFGLLFASFILLFGLCMGPMINNYSSSVRQAAPAEYMYLLKAPHEIDEESAETFSLKSLDIWFGAGDRNLEVSFYGIANNSRYWASDVSALAENEIILSDGLSKKMGLSIGDIVSFTDSYTQDKYILTIAGKTDYPAGFAAFMDCEKLNSMLDRDMGFSNGYLSEHELDIPAEYIATVITPEDMEKAGDQMTSAFLEMASICLTAALVIYLVVLYVLTKIVIDKNAQSISFMKVMGYSGAEIRKLYLHTTTIAVGISLLLALPLSAAGLRFAFSLAFVRMNGYLEPYLPPQLFAVVAATGLACYLFINLIHMRQVDKIKMAEVLKNRE